jgi:hypothetical protein
MARALLIHREWRPSNKSRAASPGLAPAGAPQRCGTAQRLSDLRNKDQANWLRAKLRSSRSNQKSRSIGSRMGAMPHGDQVEGLGGAGVDGAGVGGGGGVPVSIPGAGLGGTWVGAEGVGGAASGAAVVGVEIVAPPHCLEGVIIDCPETTGP